MKILKYTSAISLLILVSATSYGKSLINSYFIDRSIQRNTMNPAFSPESNYISLPVLGGFQIGSASNFGIDNFIFNINGSSYTYLNKNVPAEEFIRKMKQDPALSVTGDVKLLGFGFRVGRHGFLSFDSDVILDGNFALPKDLFCMTKLGMPSSPVTYKLNSLDLNQMSYGQFGVAYRHDMSELVPGLSIGARFRYIALVDAIDVNVNNAEIYMSDDKWMVNTDAAGIMAASFVKYNPATREFDETGIYSLAGGGVLFDLGAEYRLPLDLGGFEGVNFSASIAGLGAVSSKAANLTQFESAGEAEFHGMSDVNMNTDISTSFENMLKDFENIANLKSVTPAGKHTFKFKPNYYLGAEAVFFDNKLSAGLLMSNHYGLNELTMAVNGKLGAFNASLSYNFISMKSLGFLLSFVPKGGVSIYVGSDCIPLSVTPQFIPVNLSATVRFGMSIVFNHKDSNQ